MAEQLRGAVVTGSSLGIGAAIARRLAQDGFGVVIDYHTHADPANALRDAITQAGGRATVMQADVAQLADLRRLIDTCVQSFGGIDVLVNNAGIEHPTPFLDIAEADFDAQLAVDLKGPFFATQYAAKQMIAQGGGGKIINISSVHEDLPMVGNVPYCCAKGGLRMLTRTICLELAPNNITVNNIAPGAVHTPIDADVEADPEKMAALLKEIPLNRMGQPEEIAKLALYLASDAAAYITGSTYIIDGGLSVNTGAL